MYDFSPPAIILRSRPSGQNPPSKNRNRDDDHGKWGWHNESAYPYHCIVIISVSIRNRGRQGGGGGGFPALGGGTRHCQPCWRSGDDDDDDDCDDDDGDDDGDDNDNGDVKVDLLCGATLITPISLLTAAHCVNNRPQVLLYRHRHYRRGWKIFVTNKQIEKTSVSVGLPT